MFNTDEPIVTASVLSDGSGSTAGIALDFSDRITEAVTTSGPDPVMTEVIDKVATEFAAMDVIFQIPVRSLYAPVLAEEDTKVMLTGRGF